MAEVSEIVGHLSATIKALPSFQLRKTNRIRTIQSSLAIENNSLSVEQVTDILEDLLKAHKSMMNGLVKENGCYRRGSVGVFGKKRTCTSCTTGRQSAFFDVEIDCLE